VSYGPSRCRPPAHRRAQIQHARKKGIPFLAILGPDEVAAGMVALRAMREGKQESLALPYAVARIKAGKAR
jgi:histidyl-tRNA synthetase